MEEEKKQVNTEENNSTESAAQGLEVQTVTDNKDSVAGVSNVEVVSAEQIIEEPPAPEIIETVAEPVEVAPVADEVVAEAHDEKPVDTSTVSIEDIEAMEEEVVEVEAELEDSDIENSDDGDEFSEKPKQASINSQPQPRKKFKFRKWMAVVACLVGAIFVVGLVLGLIPVRRLDDEIFDNWISVDIFDSTSSANAMTQVHRDQLDGDNRIANWLHEGLDSTSHSILRSVFEGNARNRLRLRTREVVEYHYEYDEDELRVQDEMGDFITYSTREVVRDSIALRDVFAATATRPGTYLLQFSFEQMQVATQDLTNSITVRDNTTAARNARARDYTIYFDTILVLINDSFGSIEEYQMFVFNSKDMIDREVWSDDANDGEGGYVMHYGVYSEVTPILIRMNTSRLYERLTDIREVIRGDRDNGTHIPDTPGDDAEIGDAG